jgi:cytochrome c oxidase subunit 2
MKARLSGRLGVAGVFLALIGIALVAPFPGSPPPTERHITLDMQQFEFAPGRIHVNRGDRVILTLAASDVVHGFHLDGYGLDTRIEPGVTQQIEFVASRAGKFRYRCSVNCGTLHPFMIGELIVGTNSPFWRAVAVIVLAAVGMLVYVTQEQQYGTRQKITPPPV